MSDTDNTFVYIIVCIVWPIIFIGGVPSPERDIPWSDDGIYPDANRSMLSLGYDFHHTFFDLVYNTIRYEGEVWVIPCHHLLLLNDLDEGELVRFTPLLYQCAIFVCRSVSPIQIQITNDPIALWKSELTTKTESLIRLFDDSQHHRLVQMGVDDLYIVCG